MNGIVVKSNLPNRWIGLSILALTLAAWSATSAYVVAQDPPAQDAPAQDTPPPAKSSDEQADDDASTAKTSDDAQESSATAELDAATEDVGLDALSAAQLQSLPGPRDPTSYGLWVLFPAIVAILLAILARQVVPALVVGVLVASYMLVPCLAADDALSQSGAIVAGFRVAAERFMLGAVTDSDHAKIMVFTLVIGFMVGVIGRNGGTRGMVHMVTGASTSRRRGALTAWVAGMVVFFDDYANSMIVGPTMQPIFDRLKLSRAKLAYIVDSTAAPVASLALIGTWVGAEIGFIQGGLDAVAANGTPLLDAQGNVITGMQAFLSSIPYRFYPILALLLVFLVGLTGRDFGPMRRSERKVLSKIDPDAFGASSGLASGEARPKWWLGMVPIGVLVLVTIGVLLASGLQAEDTLAAVNRLADDGTSLWAQTPWWERASTVISNADSYLSIFYGAVLSAIVAVVITMISRVCSTRDAVDAGLDGMARMFPAVVILVLAWSLSSALITLKLGDVVGAQLQAQDFPAVWFPLAVFVCSAFVSFATGTSWGTMGILCPMVVQISVSLIGGMETAEALPLFYASIGGVLAGAVFGDHCSPISDTTVLSSIATGCRHEEHVWTQLPYALVAAVAAMVLGDVACSVYGYPWYMGLGAGAIFLVLVVFVVGRKPTPSFELAEA